MNESAVASLSTIEMHPSCLCFLPNQAPIEIQISSNKHIPETETNYTSRNRRRIQALCVAPQEAPINQRLNFRGCTLWNLVKESNGGIFAMRNREENCKSKGGYGRDICWSLWGVSLRRVWTKSGGRADIKMCLRYRGVTFVPERMTGLVEDFG
jgi:hypothetical protein